MSDRQIQIHPDSPHVKSTYHGVILRTHFHLIAKMSILEKVLQESCAPLPPCFFLFLLYPPQSSFYRAVIHGTIKEQAPAIHTSFPLYPKTLPTMPPHNRWNDEQRTVLHMIKTEYTFSTSEGVQVFNHVFADHLRGQGLSHGLSGQQVRVQYTERNMPIKQHLWQEALRQPTTPAEHAVRDGYRLRIQGAAAALGLDATLSAPVQPVASLGASATTSAGPSTAENAPTAPAQSTSSASPQDAGSAANQPHPATRNTPPARQGLRSADQQARPEAGDAAIAPTSTTNTHSTGQGPNRPTIERGEEYLYMIHSRDLA